MPGLADVDVPDGTYLTDYLTDRAIDLIKDNASEGAPYFLNLWYYAVHTPIEAPEERVEKYRQKARRLGLDKQDPFVVGASQPAERAKDQRIRRRTIQSDPVYAAMIETVDENIGRLMDAIKATGQERETLVIFTSDNGGLSSAESSPTCNYPLSEGKGWRYEGGIREPLIVSWPGVVEPGSVTAEPVTSPDFYPTMVAAAGCADHRGGALPYPALDGESFLPLLRGEQWSREKPLFWHFPHYGNQGDTPGSAIRAGEWKLLEFFEAGHTELYHITQDPGEQRDMSAKEPDRLRELSALLHEWERSVGARRPVRNPDYQPWPGRTPVGRNHEPA
jgi:arylsulfatase A-like enzyme